MKCEKCGFKNDKGKNFCTNCGAVLKKKTVLSKKQLIIICASGLAVFAVICTAVFFLNKKEIKAEDTSKQPAALESSSQEKQTEKPSEESETQEIKSESEVSEFSPEAPSSVSETVPEQLKITDGYFYDYSPQDLFADEWRFFADGTCSVKMRPQTGMREYETEYYTYSMNGNTVLIYEGRSTLTWEFRPADKCCYYYYSWDTPDGNSQRYRVTIFHSDNILSQSEIDNGIEEYSGKRTHIIKVS
mgnify:CR=1 FL=1